jgi:ATP-dependent Clp protease adaptor protein ClpS
MTMDADDPIGGAVRGEGETALATESEERLERPRRFRVLLLNDDYTTMEFVVMILMNVFHHPEARAVEIMLHVHHHGVGVAGVYPHQVAETKVVQVSELARSHEFPLRCTMEPA